MSARRGLTTSAIVVVAGLSALLGMAAAASAKIIADNGFRPARNGFSFTNYTAGYAGLGPNQMRALYGSRVCAVLTKRDGCVLTPPAQQYASAFSKLMNNGHCYGMATISLLLFRDLWHPFAAGPLFGLKLKGATSLQRTIAYAWMWQNLQAVTSGRIVGTPERILSALSSALRKPGGEMYVLVFFPRKGSGGHGVTPYAVDDLGGGRYDLLVYDNNHPGVVRRVHVNTRTNTWSYQLSTNPKNPESLWDGDAKTKNLQLWPVLPGFGVHPCPFCAQRGRPAGADNQIQLEGNPRDHAHLLIIDSRGRRLGYVGDRLLSEIPGGHASAPVMAQDWSERPEPIYTVPASDNVTVLVDGRGLHAPDTESVSVVGPAHDAAIDDIRIRPGELNAFTLAGSAASLRYKSAPGQPESPLFDLGLVGSRGDFRFTIRALGLTPSSTFASSLNRRGSTLTFRDLAESARSGSRSR
jgi:hypothetical protein